MSDENPLLVAYCTVVSRPLAVGTHIDGSVAPTGVSWGSHSRTVSVIVRGWKAHWPLPTDPAGLTPVSVFPLTPWYVYWLTPAWLGVLVKKVCCPAVLGKPLASASWRFPLSPQDWLPPTRDPVFPSGPAASAIINNGGVSSLRMVPVALPSAIVAPVGFVRLTVKVSLAS